MSIKNRDVSIAAHRFPSQSKTVASTRALVLVSVLAAVSIAAAAGGLIPSTQGVHASRAPTAMAASADFARSARQATHATHGRGLAARRVCEQMLERSGPDGLTAYSICVRKTLAEDSML